MEGMSQITSLIGDPVRTNILWLLIDGRAYTGNELALMTDTSPQNISMHVSKLLQADLLAVECQGRHKYYRLASAEVASAIEAIANLVPKVKVTQAVNAHDHGLKHCRTCYDHLAGEVGVQLAETMLAKKLIKKDPAGYQLTPAGRQFFEKLDIDVESLMKQRRPLLKPCLDWTERKHHVAGSLGAAWLSHMLKNDWLRKKKNSREVIVSAKGQKEFYERLRITVS
ncbi:putative HTH-type transcriptional regulator YdfF [Cytophagales bacterium WSM2-2]|nr:putative HTH-type transcriptional regulator YdfF [Cytophagales bacterium WSM2-2]